MKTVWQLVWFSQYGTEEIDEFDTLKEAREMKAEYLTAYGEGTIKIKRLDYAQDRYN